MRTTLVIAAHNEGDRLWQTVRSCVESCAGLDSEIVVADDCSSDGSVTEMARRFPLARVVRHEERRGASPTKALGARHARGEVLVFLDGHCHPEPGAIARLVADVEHLKGQAIITPAVPALCTARWKNATGQIGHGYRLDLERFDCGWLPLETLRAAPHRGRQFYESPALIGCALALSRELYDTLWGFDAHMLFWGVEDLDFGLKCWLMGYPILHDPEAVIGHRFRQAFDNYEVPLEQLLVNQLRMARKQFAPGVWSDWVERCRQRHPGRLADHPEGLWARVWTLFEEQRASAESERSYLQSRRVRDEFWYAERFGLDWPRLQSSVTSASAVVPAAIEAFQAETEPSPSPPPCDCEVTGVEPDTATVCVGTSQTFAAQGENLDDVKWSAPGGDPDEGSGATFSTEWDTTGTKTVTASCCDTSASAEVT
ncbi:MAG TPA: glycosyltransferase, partial [Planctomycetaceae bacterium]|nr:glycosyltransferase [Planctomycetaceae bacterium]